jgi:hypothetical protein
LVAVTCFVVVWGGWIATAWRSWANVHTRLADAGAAMIDLERSRLLQDAIAVSCTVGLFVALIALWIARFGPAFAPTLIVALASPGLVIPFVTTPHSLDGPQPSNCGALMSVPEGGGWMTAGWSMSDFGDVVIVWSPDAPPRRVICS